MSEINDLQSHITWCCDIVIKKKKSHDYSYDNDVYSHIICNIYLKLQEVLEYSDEEEPKKIQCFYSPSMVPAETTLNTMDLQILKPQSSGIFIFFID